MKNSTLKEISKIVVIESYTTKDEKKRLLALINEANNHKLMGFLLDGKIPSKLTEETKGIIEDRFNSLVVDKFIKESILTEQHWGAAYGNLKKAGSNLLNTGKDLGKTAVNVPGVAARAATSLGKGATGAVKRVTGAVLHPLKTAGGAAKGMIALWLIYRGLKGIFNQQSRRCGVFGFGKKRQQCMAQVRAELAHKQINTLSKMKSECKSQANPAKCVLQMDSKMVKAKKDLSKAQMKARELASQGKVGTPANTVKLI